MRRVRGCRGKKKRRLDQEIPSACKARWIQSRHSIRHRRAFSFVTGLSLFVGAIGLMNITFVRVEGAHARNRKRAKLWARRMTHDPYSFLIGIHFAGLAASSGLGMAYVMCPGISSVSLFSIQFSTRLGRCKSMAVSLLTVGFTVPLPLGPAPAWIRSPRFGR